MKLDIRMRVRDGLVLIGAIMAAHCGGNDQPVTHSPATGLAGAPSVAITPQTASPVAVAGTVAMPSAPVAPASSAPNSSVPNQPVSPQPSAGAPSGGGVPCDVADVVSQNCTSCHATVPMYGAPMPLMKHADFHAMSKSTPTKKIFEVMPVRINATDVTKRMPPASGAALAPSGLKALNDWLAGGAIAATPSCEITVKPSTSTMPPTGTEQPPATAPEATTMGGATDKPQNYNDPMMKCYEFRAHAEGDKTKPFQVGTSPDMYTNFSFAAPWKGMQYARSFRILDGNASVIHHWLLYKDTAPGVDGQISPSIGAHPTGELIHGWAPGGSSSYLDKDVGLEMPSDVGYTLETHHNISGSVQTDGSGIEVCVTPTVPKNIASLSWLGTDTLGGTTATGVCQPVSKEPIHIIGVSPHMHLKGRHMKAVITRAGGKTEILHDEPFDFQYQHSYSALFTIMPGDSITTTCTFSAPAQFGEGTNDEMCYMFTLYYPKLSLTNGNPIATLIHGPNTCLQ